jgi:predicted porin
MKLKTTAIAAAVAGSLVAPLTVQADDGTVYASARVGLNHSSAGDVSDLRVRGFGSRFGMKGESDLGNGMTGFGKFEFGVAAQGAGPNVSRRHAHVGIKGDFGSVTLGQAYHTYYNHVYGATDGPWWGSGYAYPSPGRTDEALTYRGGSGDVSFGVTLYLEAGGEETIDGTEFAASFGAGDLTIGLGMQSFEVDDDPTTGVVVSGISIGDGSLGIGFQSQGDASSFTLNASMGPMYAHFESGDDGADSNPNSLTVGYTKGLGPRTTSWYEFVTTNEDAADSTVLRAVLKYDIL